MLHMIEPAGLHSFFPVVLLYTLVVRRCPTVIANSDPLIENRLERVNGYLGAPDDSTTK